MFSRILSVPTVLVAIAIFAGASSAFAQALDTGYNPNADATVRDVHVLANGNMLVAGGFATVDGHPTNGIALLDSNGNAITSFTSGLAAADDVRAFAVDGSGNIVIVGEDGTNPFVKRLLGATGGLDAAFNAVGGITGSVVNAVAIQANGAIVIGGAFSVVDSVAANNIARLSGTGGDRDL
ncbi:MAG: hypothetical protein V3V10_00430, partial [Planctomycetota bacterium]